MRILLINHYAGGPEYGMEHRPWYLADAWLRMGHEVLIVAAEYAHTRIHQPPKEVIGKITDISGAPALFLSTPRYSGNGAGRVINMLSFMKGLYRRSSQLSKKFQPDVVIASSTYPPDIWPAHRIARKSKAKLVWEVHDLWPLSPMELGGYSKRHPFMMWLQRAENFACKKAQKVVSLLPCTTNHLVSHGMEKTKFAWVPNGIAVKEWDTSPAPPEPHNTLIEDLKKRGMTILGYTGALGVANAMDPLIKAAELCKKMKVAFVITGHGPEKENLMQQSAEKGLTNVHFCDPVPKKQLPALLSLMDVLYVGFHKNPLYRFGVSPNKIYDYMMSGKPIIQAIEAGNNPVKEAGCGIAIRANDPQAIAEAIQQMVAAAEPERIRMGEAGKAFVLQHHEFDVLAQRFLDAIR
jgi:glycosyltransferase involved in cell wall biosynthesis